MSTQSKPPTLLLVRPQMRQAADLAVCARLGWNVLPFAPLQIDRLPENAVALLCGLQQADVVFWVSPTAVDVACELLAGFSGSHLCEHNTAFRLPECLGNNLNHIEKQKNAFSGCLKAFSQTHIAVGKATAARLREYGAQNVLFNTAGNDSEAVFALDAWRRLPEKARVLIVRGEGGRDWLAQQLAQLNLLVDRVDIYRRVPCALDWAAFERANPQAAWVTSSELARELFTQTPPKLTQKLHSLIYFAHHARIGDTLRNLGAQQVFGADSLDSALNLLNLNVK